MPPKKKDDKGKTAEPADSGDEQKVAMENELQVAVLKSRLGRYQEAGEKLAVEGFKLADELAKQKLTLQDINEFLTNELKARSVATTQLEERVLELTKQMQDVQKEAQAEIARVRAEAAAEVSAADSRVEHLTAQLEGNAEFLERREQLERELRELKGQLETKQKEAEQKLSDLERRHLQDKEKMRQEMAMKIRETKIAMAQLADQHLESSTKRTLVENEAMAAELAYHSAQSSRLAEANNNLRAETAEMRRQLAVAQKTVESTARKNLLLQQTIKAILKCLQEEGPAAATAVSTVAAAAGSNQQLQECVSFALREPGADSSSGAQQQQQQEGVQQQEDALATGGEQGLERLNSTDIQQQQGVQEGPAQAGVAGDIVQQLEQKVTSLSDDLDAAKQALAAAMQGLIPETAAGPVSVVFSPQRQQQQQQTPGLFAAVRDSVVTPKLSPKQGTSSKTVPWFGPGAAPSCAAPGSPTGSSRSGPPSSRSRRDKSHSPSRHRQPQDAGWEANPAEGALVTAAGQQGSGAAAVGQALEDGVAAFVLYCVQQLRRGGTAGSAAAAAGSATAAATAPSLPTSNTAFGSATPGSSSMSNSTCSSPTGRSRPSRGPGAAAAVSMRSVSPSVLGPGYNAQSLIGYAAADGSGTPTAAGSTAAVVVNEGVVREQLARLLLDQLHSYARHKVSAFQGMQLVLPGLEPSEINQQQQGLQQQGELDQPESTPISQASESAALRGNRGFGLVHPADPSMGDSVDSISKLLQEGLPNHPLLMVPGAAGGPPSSRNSSIAATPHGFICTPGPQAGMQVLPPLPSLLGTVQQQRSQGSIASPGSTVMHGNTAPSPLAAATGSPGAAAGGPSAVAATADAQTGAKSSTEDLFGALMSDLRPWGTAHTPAASGAAAAADSAGSTTTKDKDRAGRSPSPLNVGHPFHGGSGSSPKGPQYQAINGLQASGLGLGINSSNSAGGSISAGRLVKAGEAAASLHSGSSLGKQQQQQQQQLGPASLEGALQLNAFRSKTPPGS